MDRYFTYTRNIVDIVVCLWVLLSAGTMHFFEDPPTVMRLQSLGMIRIIRLQPLFKYLPGSEAVGQKLSAIFKDQPKQIAAASTTFLYVIAMSLFFKELFKFKTVTYNHLSGKPPTLIGDKCSRFSDCFY